VELIIFVGLQGSGKSTFYHTYFAGTHEHVSKDLMRNNRKPQRRQIQLIESALERQQSVVVDNTHPTVEVRKPLIELGRAFGTKVIGYYFEAELSQCIERNKQRAGKARVPDVAIYVTSKRLERPTYIEGFDKLYIVRISKEMSFEVQMLADDESTIT